MYAEYRFQSAPLSFENPVDIIVAETLDGVLPALDSIEHATANGSYAAGFIGYEAAPAFDPAYRVREGGALPLLMFGIFNAPVERRVGAGLVREDYSMSGWRNMISEEEHASGMCRIREAIAGGYTYQVNYTMRLRAEFEGDDYAYWLRLLRNQQARGRGYGAYLDLGRHRILSASPELFFRRDGDRIVTRPMKGTTPRGRWAEEDDVLREDLERSEKDRAENLMIVDLLRNDLGRIAKVGTVNVDELFAIETYPTVFQMTSQISATLRPGTSLIDVFRALFPCGSVTGAPKISTMALIADLETNARGAYCGAIGYVEPGGNAVFNVAIRTVTIDTETGTAEYGTGGGITWDSNAVDEYREAASKAAILREERPEFDLLETLCLRDGVYLLLDRHLDRLAASARYFDMDVDTGVVRAKLAEFATDRPTGAYRTRLLVAQDSSIRVEAAPLGEPPLSTTVAVAIEPVDSRDRFLYHKTTHRAVYDRHRKAHPDAFDVLLWNERGEATEFTIGNLVVEIDGKMYTPPVECGLLPGTMRAELLSRGEIEERVIMLSELTRVSRMWLVNSVRGWVVVRLEP